MLRHVVLWTFKDAHDGTDRPAMIAKVVALLRRCEAEVPSLRTFELGGAADGLETTYDLILVSSFDDAAGLQAYVVPGRVALTGCPDQLPGPRRVAT